MRLNKFILLTSLLLSTTIAVADIQVSNLQDFQFHDFDLHGSNSQDLSLCIYNSDNDGYRVTVYSNHGNGDFVMSNGVSSFPYQVKWSQSANGSGYIELHPNTPSPSMMGASQISNCNGRDNANIQIHVSAAALQNITAGDYSGALNIRVEPV